MQHGRRRRLQDAHCPQRDEGRVEGQHKAVVGADTALQGVGDGLEDDQLLEAVGLDGHICDLAGDGSTGVDGDADVSGREGGGVVDAVADHHDGVALALGPLDESSLVLGQDFGEELVHTHLLCDGGGGALAVTGHHDGVGDAEAAQSAQHAGSFRTQRVGDADDAGQTARSGQIEVRVLRLKVIELLALVLGDGAVLVLKDEVVAADDDPLTADAAGDAVGHDILYFGVHLFVGDAALFGLPDDGVGHRVGEVLLEAGGQLQNFALAATGEGDDLDHLGGSAGQGAGLVEDDGVSLGQGLEVLAALDGDMACAALAHGRKNGQRHGELEGAGEIDHQAGDGAGGVPGQGVGDDGSTETPGDQTIGQSQRTVLGAGLQLLGLLDHGHDLVVAVCAALGLGGQDALALFHHSAGVDGGTDGLAHRHGLAGQSGLVDHGFALDDGAVQRDHVAGADDDLVARVDLGERHEHFGTLCADPDLIDIQGHAAGQVVEALLAGPLLQQGADVEQEHDGACGGEVAPQDGNADAQSIQHLDFQFAAPQAAHTLPEELDGAEHGVGGVERGGQEQLAQHPACQEVIHLFLIFLIDAAAVGAGDQCVQFGVIETVGAQGGDGILAGTGVIHHHIARPLVDLGLAHSVVVVQIGFQHIGPVQGHPHIADVYPQTAAALMKNSTFHIRISSAYYKK